MAKVSFTKEVMLDILDGVTGEVIRDNIVDTSRWSNIYELIFSLGVADSIEVGKEVFYRTSYSVGATEYQDEGPWEYDTSVECTEVVPVEVTSIEWKVKKDK